MKTYYYRNANTNEKSDDFNVAAGWLENGDTVEYFKFFPSINEFQHIANIIF